MHALQEAAAWIGAGKTAYVLTRLDTGAHIFFAQEEAMLSQAGIMAKDVTFPRVTDNGAYFLERLCAAPELVVLGGGHISRPLCTMASTLGMNITVIDDRADFARQERFPGAKRVLCGDFVQTLQTTAFSPKACFIIITRGHAQDTQCLAQVLCMPRSYVGMIGSKKKVAEAMEEMRAKGFDTQTLSQVAAPIGLPIGAQTPAEIALSILAQLVQVLRGQDASGGMDASILGALRKEETRGAKLFTILEKRGSAPRGAGTRMMVLPDGEVLGTLGGGSAEFFCIRRAREEMGVPWQDIFDVEVKSLGMTCGGSIKVLAETL